MPKKKKNNTGLIVGGVLLLLLLTGKKKGGGGPGTLQSAYYDLNDFQHSDTAKAKGITEQFGDVPIQYIQAGSHLAKNVMDPITKSLGWKIPFDSWWRHAKTNKEVGGSGTSFHLTGEAIDVNGTVTQNKKILKAIVNLNIPYTELILYGSKTSPSRLHIALRRNRENERETLFKKGSGSYETLSSGFLKANFG